MPRADVLVVAVDGTSGWRIAANELIGALERGGARVARASAGAVNEVRTFALTDFVQARAARRAALRGIAEHDPRAIIYCSITAALLAPRPGAIWLDSVAAENRPGRHGVWQRTVERRRLAAAPLVLAMSPRALTALPGVAREVVVVPTPIEPSGSPAPERDLAAVVYAANPVKRRLDYVLEAWAAARRAGETLVVAGTDWAPVAAGVEFAGRLPAAEYRALLRRARVFAAAPRHEEYGIAPLEALADGCVLVTTPASGGYPALDLARQLDARLVSEDLRRAIRTALDDPVPGYAQRAAALLAPYRHEAVDRTVAGDVLPRLLTS